MLKLWPVQHKSIFKWLRGHIRWALVMNETLVITSATLTQNSWRPLPISCFQQSATSLVQMSGKPCANYAVMMRVEDLAREFSFHVFFEKASLKRGQYTIYTVHPVTPFGLSCAPFDSGTVNFLILELGWYKLKRFGTHKTHYILECSRQLYSILSYIWTNLFLTNIVSLFEYFFYKGQGEKISFVSLSEPI